jgi:hypothetical protein
MGPVAHQASTEGRTQCWCDLCATLFPGFPLWHQITFGPLQANDWKWGTSSLLDVFRMEGRKFYFSSQIRQCAYNVHDLLGELFQAGGTAGQKVWHDKILPPGADNIVCTGMILLHGQVGKDEFIPVVDFASVRLGEG